MIFYVILFVVENLWLSINDLNVCVWIMDLCLVGKECFFSQDFLLMTDLLWDSIWDSLLHWFNMDKCWSWRCVCNASGNDNLLPSRDEARRLKSSLKNCFSPKFFLKKNKYVCYVLVAVFLFYMWYMFQSNQPFAL